MEPLQHCVDVARAVLKQLVVAVEDDEGNLTVAQHRQLHSLLHQTVLTLRESHLLCVFRCMFRGGRRIGVRIRKSKAATRRVGVCNGASHLFWQKSLDDSAHTHRKAANALSASSIYLLVAKKSRGKKKKSQRGRCCDRESHDGRRTWRLRSSAMRSIRIFLRPTAQVEGGRGWDARQSCIISRRGATRARRATVVHL